MSDLSGVVLLSASELQKARALADAGLAVVIVGPPSDEVGACVARLEAAGHRVATFTGDVEAPADRAALDELVGELYGRESPRS